jgi:predicted DNA-binding ribbon-helix-helix protein
MKCADATLCVPLVHSIQFRTEATERHPHFNNVREVSLNRFGAKGCVPGIPGHGNLRIPWHLVRLRMKSPIVKRTLRFGGRKIGISLEDAFWSELKEIAHSQGTTLSKLVAQIDDARQQGNLSSAIRLYVLDHVRSRGQGREKD